MLSSASLFVVAYQLPERQFAAFVSTVALVGLMGSLSDPGLGLAVVRTTDHRRTGRILAVRIALLAVLVVLFLGLSLMGSLEEAVLPLVAAVPASVSYSLRQHRLARVRTRRGVGHEQGLAVAASLLERVAIMIAAFTVSTAAAIIAVLSASAILGTAAIWVGSRDPSTPQDLPVSPWSSVMRSAAEGAVPALAGSAPSAAIVGLANFGSGKMRSPANLGAWRLGETAFLLLVGLLVIEYHRRVVRGEESGWMGSPIKVGVALFAPFACLAYIGYVVIDPSQWVAPIATAMTIGIALSMWASWALHVHGRHGRGAVDAGLVWLTGIVVVAGTLPFLVAMGLKVWRYA